MLAYKLLSFDNYATLAEHFSTLSLAEWLILVAVFVLLPLNLGLESAKWRLLTRKIQPISASFSFKSVLIGQLGAFLTPNRIGELPARAALLAKENFLSALAVGAVGSALLTAAITLFGGVSAVFYGLTFSDSASLVRFAVAVIVVLPILLLIAICFYRSFAQFLLLRRHRFCQQIGQGLLLLDLPTLLQAFLLSMLRFAIFSCQFWAVLAFMGVQLSLFQAFVAIPTIYLLVTYTPSFAAADAAVRGSYAMLILSAFSANSTAVAIASVLLWFINFCLPMLIGSLFFRRKM